MEGRETTPREDPHLAEVLGSVMTHAEYAELGEHDYPYIYRLEGGGKALTYVGSEHINDPQNPTFSRIRAEFEQAKPDLVLVEGLLQINGVDRDELAQYARETDDGEIIREMGECGFAVKLGAEAGALVYCPEPSPEAEIRALESRGFTRDELFLFYATRSILSYLRTPMAEPFERYITPYLEELRETSGWEGYDFSYDHYLRLHRAAWGKDLDFDDPRFYREKVDPVPWAELRDRQGRTNEVARGSSSFRDHYIVAEIARLLGSHDRVLVVYGAAHAVLQEPALKKLFASF